MGKVEKVNCNPVEMVETYFRYKIKLFNNNNNNNENKKVITILPIAISLFGWNVFYNMHCSCIAVYDIFQRVLQNFVVVKHNSIAICFRFIFCLLNFSILCLNYFYRCILLWCLRFILSFLCSKICCHGLHKSIS